MSLKMIRMLAAAALFLSAGAAHAQVYNFASGTLVTGVVTGTIYTASITGPIIISGTGTYIDASGTHAINFNSPFAASNTVTVQSGAAISNTAFRISEVTDPNAGVVTINNSGTLITTGSSTKLISGSSALHAININNSGLISGSIFTGPGGSNINLNGGSMSGVISYTAGTNNLLVSGTTLNGNVTGDSIASNTAIFGGTGQDTITVGTGGLIRGAISDTTANDNDSLNFTSTAGAYTLDSSNTVGGIENINVSNSLTVNSTSASPTLSGVQYFRIDPSGTVTLNTDPGLLAGGSLNNSGTLNIAAGQALATTNGINVNNTGTVSGDIITGAGNDNVRLAGGTVNGNINLGNGTNTLAVSNSTLNGNFIGGVNADTINIYSGGLISGTITDATANDGDTINFHTSAGVYNLTNTISGIENINVSNTLNVNTGITGLQNLQVNPSGTVNVNSNLGLVSTGHMNVSGTLNIAAGHTVTANNVFFAPTGILGIAISDSTHAGQLITSASIATAPRITFNIGPNAGYLGSGIAFSIISSTGSVATPSVVTNASPLYSFKLAQTSGGLGVTVQRAALSSLVTGAAAKGVAGAIDAAGVNSTGDLLTIQNDLNAATSAAQINNLVQSLAPASQTGAAVTSVNVGTASSQNVDNRLASLRMADGTSLAMNGGGTSGLSTGDATYNHNFWAQGFANHTDQDNHDGSPGFTANTAGGNIGADTDLLIDGLTTGAAVTYAYSSVDGKGAGNDNTDLDTYLLTLYGSKVFDHGLYLNGQVGGGYNDYTTSRQVVGFAGQTSGKYNGEQATAKLDGGIDLPIDQALSGLVLTPLASAQYTWLRTGAYTENGPAALNVNSATFNAVDLGAGAQLAINYALPQGLTLQPSLRARYIYRAGDNTVDTTGRFIAGGPAFNAPGVALDRSSVDLGGGLQLTSLAGATLGLTYDADVRPSLIGHTGQLKVRVPF